eukprot:TRINITY_DN42229_c0_g1_i1.p1 TRINITY_DN42229_c0_g1~~TRINITY_DN42229_c0_g1_i1.p1  ORF type:complete len:495 (+),score=170.73 TRINITY_DN42229_c0_g1_i1:73-1557(+)
MSVTIEIESRTEGYGKHTLTVEPTTQAANYDTLRVKLDLQNRADMRVTVVNPDGTAVLLTPSGVVSGNSYFFEVAEWTSVEMDGKSEKWRSDPRGLPWEDINDFADKGSALENAAANGFLGNGTHTPLNILFPDANAASRVSYQSGIASQTPASMLPPPHDDTHVAGLSHEPTISEIGAQRAQLLRWAFETGTTSSQKPAEALPGVEELREAYKRGKEAVCITISQEDWPKLNKETFKLCSIPVEYAVYEGGAKKKLAANKDYRYALRECFKHGVDDAWGAREHNAVTAVTADLRVPTNPTMVEAFTLGQNAQKAAQAALPGSQIKMTPEFEMKLEGGTEDPKYATSASTYKEGLANQWASYSGSELPKIDTRFPDTGVEERDAYNVGVAARKVEEKRKEEERIAEEMEKEAAAKGETTFAQEYLEPFIECLMLCHPKNLFTEDNDGRLLCCGTTAGDWLLIFLCFILFYLYVAMWFWAFIETMFVVAEPQRPW